ncbi:hypothetical protein GCM10025776_25980 [Corallincola platygyrae]
MRAILIRINVFIAFPSKASDLKYEQDHTINIIIKSYTIHLENEWINDHFDNVLLIHWVSVNEV